MEASMIRAFLSALILLASISGTLAQPATTQPTALIVPFTNASSTGTTVDKLVKLTSGHAVIMAISDTDNSVGIAVNGAGTSGTVQVAVNGVTLCVFDGATTAGDYIQISSSTAGDCHDTGSTSRPGSGQSLGRVLSTNVSGGTYAVSLLLNGATGSAGSATIINNAIGGLTLSNDGSTPNSVLDIAAGTAADSTNAVVISISAFTKSTAGAWAGGSGSNGMGNGLTIANSTWYHVCLANNSGTADIWFDTSATCANRPSGITDTKYRRIGSFKTDASAHILKFTQFGPQFLWTTMTTDQNAVSINNTPAAYTLGGVPTGVKVSALIWGNLESSSGAWNGSVYSPDITTTAGFILNAASGASQTASLNVRTNTSAQVEAVISTATGGQMSIWTLGWIDDFGQ